MPAPRRPAARAAAGVVLLADDGIRVSARHDRPAPGADADLGFVVAHGFTGSWRRPDILAIVATLRRDGGVVSFDFRGHGRSGGLSTVGDREVLDLTAAVRWARLLGYTRIAVVGWSMGAGVAVRQAALAAGEDRPDAVVAVSGPSRWHYQGTAPMRRLHRAVGTRIGRGVLATVFGTRVAAAGWDPAPEPPDALAGRVAPTPMLVVHGSADHYFPVEHARWLALAGGPGVGLWIEPGFGHAETAATPELVARIGAWARRGPVDGDRGQGSARMRPVTRMRP